MQTPPQPPTFWENENAQLLALILPVLQEGAEQGVDGASEYLFQLGLAFDPTLAHADAITWARTHTDALLQQFGTTNQNVVGAILGNWIATPGGTMGQLADQLARQLGGLGADEPIPPAARHRARLIGVTEATRAFARGEELAYQRAGIPKVVFGPPGHPRCRCWERPVRLQNGDFVVVWSTNRDEIVCQQPILVPWQPKPMPGCRSLHNMVISEGEYLGKRLSEV